MKFKKNIYMVEMLIKLYIVYLVSHNIVSTNAEVSQISEQEKFFVTYRSWIFFDTLRSNVGTLKYKRVSDNRARSKVKGRRKIVDLSWVGANFCKLTKMGLERALKFITSKEGYVVAGSKKRHNCLPSLNFIVMNRKNSFERVALAFN